MRLRRTEIDRKAPGLPVSGYRHVNIGVAVVIAALLLSGCELAQLAIHASKTFNTPEKKTVKVATRKETPKKAPKIVKRKIGKPYNINGVWYYPKDDPRYDETGIASWYGSAFHGKVTANGERYDMTTLTAAHKTLPMPSMVEVTNLENGRVLLLRVNDRGPFVQGRIIDVSRRAADLLGFRNKGTARVRVRLANASAPDRVKLASAEPFKANPQGRVTSQTLTAPKGAKAKNKANLTRPNPKTRVARAGARVPVVKATSDKRTVGKVYQAKVKPTRLYVQAGAFRNFQNANRLRIRVSSFGSARISRTLLDGVDIFRVRVGPVATVADADRVLQNVVNEGYSGARIVVD